MIASFAATESFSLRVRFILDKKRTSTNKKPPYINTEKM